MISIKIFSKQKIDILCTIHIFWIIKNQIYSNVVGLIKDEENTYFNTKRNTNWNVTISDKKSKNSCALINILKYALKSY
jgi:hypothetical protein